MLVLEYVNETQAGYEVIISGPKGRVRICDLVWIVDRQDLLEVNYWSAWGVINGIYHCCLSIPGKVALLPPQ